jgi:arylsulfatase A-like enzyme
VLRNLRALERDGFVTASHYATYPYSRRAYYSIYSGWYPAHGMRGSLDLIDQEDPHLPGLVSTARAAGYHTMAFVPEVASEWEDDIKRYRSLGFDQHLVPPNAELAFAPQGAEERVAWQRQRDNDARAMLIAAIDSAATSGRPWLATFNPQLTHGPWPGAASAGNEARICALGLKLFDEVDRGLGEILDALERTGQRDRTVVVALGDHGLRTSAEYPAFRGATLDDITFHVPLVIHVPGLFREAHPIPWRTSHVDIAPSVLDLLGLSARRQFEQGSPMWDPRLEHRRIFVYAQGYLGADGYIDDTNAVMLNYFLGSVSRTPWNGSLRFATRDLLSSAGAPSDSAAAVLHRAVAIQRLYLSRLSVLFQETHGDGATRPPAGPTP